MAKNPKKWWEVYPQGTSVGNEEARLFKSLAQQSKFKFRSTDALSNDTQLSNKRVEEILAKYHSKGIVVQSPSNPKLWAYWENVDAVDSDDKKDVIAADKEKRIKKK